MTPTNDQEFLNSNGAGYRGNGHYRGETPLEISPANAQNDEEIDLRHLIALMLHNKWLILAITGICTLGAVVFALMQMPIYESSGTIIITQSSNRYSMAGNDLSNLLMSSYGIGVGSNVENELEILNSRTLAWSLAQKIHKERFDVNGNVYPVLWRDYPDDPTITTPDTVAMRIMENKTVKQRNKMSSILTITYQSPSPEEARRIVDLIIETYSEASTSTNRVQAKAALNFLSSELENVKALVDSKESQLRDFMEKTRLVQLDAQTTELVTTLARLTSEEQALQVKLVAVNEGIKRQAAELELIKPGLSEQFKMATAPLIQRLQTQLAEFETERVLILARNPGIEESDIQDPRLKQLESQIRIVKEEIAKATKDILDNNNPTLIGFLGTTDGGVAQQVQRLRTTILELQIQKTQFEAQAKLLREQIAEYEAIFNALPDNMLELARLKRDLQVNEQLYLTIAKQSAEMALWEQTQSGLARIVDTGYLPTIPVKPKKKLIVLIGLLLGGALSVGVVFIKEVSKKEIDSVEKLRKKGLPILSVIPDLNPYIQQNFEGKEHVEVGGQKISTGLVTLLDSISPSAESYRRLQSNIMYSKPDDPYKVVLITSSNKAEGKTTLSANLAISMAETGNRVLLVDCDFRRPRVHNVFGFPASPGLIDLLFEDADPHEFIRQTVVDNVFVLTAGNRPPNPAEINRSRKLRNLISKLRYEFDYVILDTPPYGIITDAAPLIKLADGIVVVAKFNQTKEGELDHTLDSLNRINANIIGTCMTAFDAKKTSGYYYTDYYYQYSYESYKDYDKREA